MNRAIILLLALVCLGGGSAGAENQSSVHPLEIFISESDQFKNDMKNEVSIIKDKMNFDNERDVEALSGLMFSAVISSSLCNITVSYLYFDLIHSGHDLNYGRILCGQLDGVFYEKNIQSIRAGLAQSVKKGCSEPVLEGISAVQRLLKGLQNSYAKLKSAYKLEGDKGKVDCLASRVSCGNDIVYNYRSVEEGIQEVETINKMVASDMERGIGNIVLGKVVTSYANTISLISVDSYINIYEHEKLVSRPVDSEGYREVLDYTNDRLASLQEAVQGIVSQIRYCEQTSANNSHVKELCQSMLKVLTVVLKDLGRIDR